MGRAQRRRAARRQQQANRIQRQYEALQNLGMNKIALKLAQNGITKEDLDNANKEGVAIGFEKTLAGVIIAAAKEFGFGQKRCLRLAEATYNEVMVAYDTPELLNKAIKQAGIKIDITDPLEPIELNKVKKARRKKNASKTAELPD